MMSCDKAFSITLAGGLLGTPVMSIDRAEIFNSLDPGSSGSNGNHNLPNGSLKLIETNQQKEQKLIRLVYKNLIT